MANTPEPGLDPLHQGVRTYFREFGNDVCDEIHRELLRPGGMSALLQKLGLPDPGDADDSYVFLLNFLRRFGSTVFMEKIGRKGPGQQDPDKYRVKVSQDKALTDQHDMRSRELAIRRVIEHKAQSSGGLPSAPVPIPSRPAPEPPPTPQGPSGQPLPRPSSQGVPVSRVSNALPPPPSAALQEPPPTARASSTANQPWDGRDRRNGKDRRQRSDRRAAVDLIFKNRRFGKDRRSGKERRKNWPPKKG